MSEMLQTVLAQAAIRQFKDLHESAILLGGVPSLLLQAGRGMRVELGFAFVPTH